MSSFKRTGTRLDCELFDSYGTCYLAKHNRWKAQPKFFEKIKNLFVGLKPSAKVLKISGIVALLAIVVYSVKLFKNNPDTQTVIKERRETQNKIKTFGDTVCVNVRNMKFTNNNGNTYTFTGWADYSYLLEYNEDNPIDLSLVKYPHKGTGVYANGIYKGEYNLLDRHGYGVFDTNDKQNHYEGTFKYDLYDKGTLTLANGMYFKGSFRKGTPYNGTWYNKNKTKSFTIVNGKEK